MRVTLVVGLGALALGCPFFHPSGPPAPDSCEGPGEGRVDALELGPGSYDEAMPFQAWEEGAAVRPQRGAQGAEMLGLRLRVTGGTPPECLGQRSTLSDDGGAVLGSSAVPLKTYLDGAGRATRTLWIPAEMPAEGQPLLIEVEAGGQRVSRRLFIGAPPDLSVPEDQSPPGDLSRPTDLTTTD